MKKKFLFIFVFAILLLVVSISLIIWYFKEVGETKIVLKKAQEKAQRPVPKEISVKVYFNNSKMNPNTRDCKAVFPVERIIPNDLIIRRRAIEELLKGPTLAEKEQGYFSSIPSQEEIIKYREVVEQEIGQAPYKGDEIKVKSFKFLTGLVYIDFSGEMHAYGGGSCRVEAIKAQIIETVKQFPKVSHAVISIEGDEYALQP